MITDEEVIEEIRSGRRRMSEDAGHDLAKSVENVKAFERKHATRIDRSRKQHPASRTRKTGAK